MSLKKLMVLGLVLLFAFVAIGCAPAADEPAPPANGDDDAPPADDAVRVALCTSGPITDGGWNTLAYEGLVSIQDEYGFEIAYTENVAQDDQVGVIRDYARAGFDVIIGHGFEWGDAMTTVAADFPDIWFAQTGGNSGGTYPNLTSGEFRTGDAGHVVGTLAAMLTESGIVGFVGAMEIPTIAEEVMSARATVESYGYEMVVGYTGSWTDVSAGYEAAMAQIEEGVDVIIGIGNAADGGAIQASEERGGDVWYIGWTGDLNHLSPDIIATSMTEDVGAVMREFVRMWLDGEEGEYKQYGITEGMKYLGTWADGVPAEAKEAALEVQQQIIDGDLTRLQIFENLGIEPLI